MTFRELYQSAREALQKAEEPQTASLIARDLICTFSGMKQEELLQSLNRTADYDLVSRVEEGVARLLEDEPLAYVLGEWEFYGLPMYVSPDVLIPRDDTCAVTELAINRGLFLEKDPRVLDLCCGSGCIGIAVGSRLKDARVTSVDISKEAIAVTRKNIQRNRLGGRMTCIQADVTTAPPAFIGKFDMIVSNPPYVTAEEMKSLPKSVREYEPHEALFGGTDGMVFYRAILQNYTSVLKPGGYVCFEFGMGQGDAVCMLLEETGYRILERKNDYNGRERAVLAQLK